MKPKLLVLTSTFPRWLDDTDPPFVYELSRRLSSDFNATVLAPHYPGSKRQEEMDGVQVHRFRYFFEPFERLAGSTGILPSLKKNRLFLLLIPFFLIGQFFSVLVLMMKVKPDVIHAHWLIPQGFMGVMVGRFMGIPCVVTAHGADVFALNGYVSRLMKNFVIKYAKTVTVVSTALLKALHGTIADSSHIKIIPMGVSVDRFSPGRKDLSLKKRYNINGPFLLYAGRLTEKKGVKYLVDALVTVKSSFPDCKLFILGSGEQKSVLQQQVHDLKLTRSVVFLGAVSNTDMPVYYATADVFIGPSIEAVGGDSEGFGLTFVEAALCGCPIIASDVGGIRDIIQHKKTGLLVQPKKSDEIADALLYALRNKDEMKGMAELARERCITRYEWQVILGQYCKVLGREKFNSGY